MLNKYCLIYICNDEIYQPEFFDTHKQAHARMNELYEESLFDTDETADFLIGENEAYCSFCCDTESWKIFKV